MINKVISHTSHNDVPWGGFIRQVIVRALLFTLGGALVLLVLGHPAWAKGLALGGLASAANFLLMSWLLPKALDPGRGKTQGLTLVSVALRFAVMALALGLALSNPQRIAIAPCALGLFMVQITLLSDRFMGGRLVGTSSEGR
jgi:ATP synthase I subunit